MADSRDDVKHRGVHRLDRSDSPAPVSPSFWTGPRVALVATLLLALHLSHAVISLIHENPTIDEVVHLPAGVTYWEKGTFKMYPHNPPLIKLIAALPVIAARPMTAPIYTSDSDAWNQYPVNRLTIAHLFAE